MNSCLYECSVMHRRLVPSSYGFRHDLFMFYLDLDEIDALAATHWLFGRQRLRLYRFRDDDHLPVSSQPLKQRVVDYLAAQGLRLDDGVRIMLLTMPRVLGHIFNPISVYFCFGARGQPLAAVAEVGNTFGEQKLFLIPAASTEAAGRMRRRMPKHYYVSPFSPLDLDFDFNFALPGDTLDLRVDDYDGERRVLLSTLSGRRRPLDDARLLFYTLKYPLLTVRVIGLIHWHAFKLWYKGVRWYRKADNRTLQRDVLEPSGTLRATPKTSWKKA